MLTILWMFLLAVSVIDVLFAMAFVVIPNAVLEKYAHAVSVVMGLNIAAALLSLAAGVAPLQMLEFAGIAFMSGTIYHRLLRA